MSDCVWTATCQSSLSLPTSANISRNLPKFMSIELVMLSNHLIFCHTSWITGSSWRRGMCNSMKLKAMPCRATQDRRVIVKSSDKTWSTGGRNGKPLLYSHRKNPINSVKRQKDATPKDGPPRLSKVLLGKNRRQLLIAPERTKLLGQSRNNALLWMCLVVKVKPDAVKNHTA